MNPMEDCNLAGMPPELPRRNPHLGVSAAAMAQPNMHHITSPVRSKPLPPPIPNSSNEEIIIAPPPPDFTERSKRVHTVSGGNRVTRTGSMDRNYFTRNELSLKLLSNPWTSDVVDVDTDNNERSPIKQTLSTGQHNHHSPRGEHVGGVTTTWNNNASSQHDHHQHSHHQHNHGGQSYNNVILSPTREALAEHNKMQNSASSKREIDDLRAKCVQMEKTMRWWSETTANWRDKWSKVRAERNRYKEEAKRLAAKLDLCQNELSKLRRNSSSENASKPQTPVSPIEDKPVFDDEEEEEKIPVSNKKPTVKDSSVQTEREDAKEPAENFVSMTSLDSGLPANSQTGSNKTGSNDNESANNDTSTTEEDIKELDQISRFLNDAVSLAGSEQATRLKFRLEEAAKTLEAEREDKNELCAQIEDLQTRLSKAESVNDELTMGKRELERDLNRIRDESASKIKILELQIEEQATKRHNLDQVIGHLREESERLLSENAAEWGRRERLETEKSNADREIKNLKFQLEELKERNRRLTAMSNDQVSGEMTRLKTQVQTSNAELNETKHALSRAKKSLNENAEELQHWQRKAETTESETKKLRSRVEDLKSQLSLAEDNIDEGSNTIRRLTRTNEELQSHVDGLGVQIEHLTSRLRALPQNDERSLFQRRPSQLVLQHSAENNSSKKMSGVFHPPPAEDDEDLSVLDTSEESLPIFDEDDSDSEIIPCKDFSQEIETDV